MTELRINIQDSKLPLFMLLAKELDFIVIDETKKPKKLSSKQKKWVDDFQTSLNEVELHTQGKIKLKSAKQLLNEL